MSGTEDATEVRRHQAPYGSKNPIPTISKYREEKAARQENAVGTDSESINTKQQEHREDQEEQDVRDSAQPHAGDSAQQDAGSDAGQNVGNGKKEMQDTSQVDPSLMDPKQLRKDLKSRRKERADRQVTDPVTHLPVTIHDFTDAALREVEANNPIYGSTQRTATDVAGQDKSDEQLKREGNEAQASHDALINRFPPPDFDALRQEVATISKLGVTAGLIGAIAVASLALIAEKLVRQRYLTDASEKLDIKSMRVVVPVILTAVSISALLALVMGVRNWTAQKISGIFNDEIWDAQRQQMVKETTKHETETTLWLNALIGSIWPVANPDLFTSLADTLEDVMQASLPKFVRMVSVEDIGQGSESVRILGIRWLPTGAAAKSVRQDGSIKPADKSKDGHQDTRDEPDSDDKAGNNDDKAPAEDMEAEEGDFVNLEVAFAYRTRSSSKTLKERTKDMHLYLAFYLPGNIKFPVWVDLRGIIGTLRMRLQLTPDPPFVALCTMTFLGQPKVDISCVPLNKHGLNIMDVPLISNFVQSAVDAAMAQYVAPKSLTLDLKEMLAGDDFKKDTTATGVLMINIKRGYDFKMGDGGIPVVKDSGSDPYVSVGWAKFGKVLWSTRLLKGEMEPAWDETFFLLVTPEEVNVDERVRLQLWDSDRFTADDDLGRIEVDLKQLMKDDNSNGKMWSRSDGFRALKSGEDMPGKLDWSVGYYSKTRLQQCQFEQQTHDPEVRTMDQLKDKVKKSCERKLREAMIKDGRKGAKDELEQQKAQELKTEQDAMIISAPPPDDYPSGLFSIQIHQITSLELERLSKKQADKDAEASDEEEAGTGLPSAYCTIIVNHRKVFKTRTKPQNSKPFYNAGCERFIRDWRDCEVFIAVRDARVHEEDALLGIVHLPLGDVFQERSQVMAVYPIAGGVGHGKIRISMVWRSVQLQAPANLLGWDYGTVEIQSAVTSSGLPQDIQVPKLKFRSNIGSGKMYAKGAKDKWDTKDGESLRLAVQKRYSSCLSIAFVTKGVMGENIPAFSVLWLKNVPDEEEQELELPVWKGDFERAKACCIDNCGEKIGSIKLKLTFWSGLGSAHSHWASKDENLRDVVEVIDAARDNRDGGKMEKEVGIVDEELTSDSSSDSSDDETQNGKIPDGSSGNKQSPIDRVKDYKKHDKSMHRRQRGVMQWKLPRTAKWARRKVNNVVKGNISGVLDHHTKDSGVETEV